MINKYFRSKYWQWSKLTTGLMELGASLHENYFINMYRLRQTLEDSYAHTNSPFEYHSGCKTDIREKFRIRTSSLFYFLILNKNL